MEKSQSSLSYYGNYYETDLEADGKRIKLRISTHPATASRMGNADADTKVSVVIYKNGEHLQSEKHNGYEEHIYYPKDISPKDAAYAIVDGVKSLIETGEYVDTTGKAKSQSYPYRDTNGELRYRTSESTKASDEKVNLQQMTNYAHDVAEALNVNGDVEVVTSEGLTGKKKQAKGWYDPKTGKITIVADNHTSLADMEQTMLHEAVAHKGLRALFGERFTTFLDNVFTNADADVRQGITDLMSKNNWDARKATEEYLASLAETTNFEEAKKNGVWEKIKDFFRDLLDAVGLSGFSGKLSDNEQKANGAECF